MQGGPPISPDGRFYWDGERWVPIPIKPAPPASGVPFVTHTTCLAIVIAGGVLIAVLLLAGIFSLIVSR